MPKSDKELPIDDYLILNKGKTSTEMSSYSSYMLVSKNRLSEKRNLPNAIKDIPVKKKQDKDSKSTEKGEILKPGKDFYETIGYDIGKLKGSVIDPKLLEKLLNDVGKTK